MQTLNLGMINFINGLVPDYSLAEPYLKKTYDIPSRLNLLLQKGVLDVSPVSSMTYIMNPKLYYILPSLGISSPGYADTVGVFSKSEPRYWHNKAVFVTGSSLSSVYLLKVLCAKYLKISPQWHIQSPTEALNEEVDQILEKYEAALFIGDRVLEVKRDHPEYQYFDLAELWKNFTSCDFVFALWLARREYSDLNEDLLEHYWRAQKSSIEKGLRELDALYQSNSLCSLSAFKRYFQVCLNYHLPQAAVSGMERFIADLFELKLIQSNVDLEFFEPRLLWETQDALEVRD